MSPSTVPPGGASPMTSCWPARSRWRWCGSKSAACPARPLGRRRPHLSRRLRAALPYSLTASQEFALAEINADLADPERMLRLLQGDVGSGKTVVALLAMARAVEAGGQAALMAPTEILARQHLATIAPLAAKVGLRIAILTGREKGRERTRHAGRSRQRRDRHRRRHPRAVPGDGRSSATWSSPSSTSSIASASTSGLPSPPRATRPTCW